MDDNAWCHSLPNRSTSVRKAETFKRPQLSHSRSRLCLHEPLKQRRLRFGLTARDNCLSREVRPHQTAPHPNFSFTVLSHDLANPVLWEFRSGQRDAQQHVTPACSHRIRHLEDLPQVNATHTFDLHRPSRQTGSSATSQKQRPPRLGTISSRKSTMTASIANSRSAI